MVAGSSRSAAMRKLNMVAVLIRYAGLAAGRGCGKAWVIDESAAIQPKSSQIRTNTVRMTMTHATTLDGL
jgi:hypothetical protein